MNRSTNTANEPDWYRGGGVGRNLTSSIPEGINHSHLKHTATGVWSKLEAPCIKCAFRSYLLAHDEWY